VNPYFIVGAVLAVAIAGGAGYVKGASHGRAEVQSAWDKERIKLAEEHAKAITAAREKEQLLQSNADQLREEANAKNQELGARVASIADSLRKRPDRAAQAGAMSGAAGAAGSSCICTARELAREDAEALIAIGKQAEELRIALNQCITQYQSLRQ
jgi:hypothetical protein